MTSLGIVQKRAWLHQHSRYQWIFSFFCNDLSTNLAPFHRLQTCLRFLLLKLLLDLVYQIQPSVVELQQLSLVSVLLILRLGLHWPWSPTASLAVPCVVLQSLLVLWLPPFLFFLSASRCDSHYEGVSLWWLGYTRVWRLQVCPLEVVLSGHYNVVVWKSWFHHSVAFLMYPVVLLQLYSEFY